MFECYDSGAPHKHTRIRVDAMWRWLLCNQAQWVMRGRNALLWWLEEEEACLGKDWRRQSDPLAKSSGRERKRLDIWFQALPQLPVVVWTPDRKWGVNKSEPWRRHDSGQREHMCTKPQMHANTYICADTHTTLNEWKMTQCDRRRLSGAAGWTKPAMLFTQTHKTWEMCLNTQNSLLLCFKVYSCRNHTQYVPSAKWYLVWFCVCVHLMWLLWYWLPPHPGSYLFSEVRRQFCLYAFVCAFDTCLVHARRAHTLLRSLSYRPGFGFCLRGSVIIQRGKQPARDLISCLGSHREVGKHYELITVLSASPAFSSDSPAKRRLNLSSFSVWIWLVCVWAIPRRLLPTCL